MPVDTAARCPRRDTSPGDNRGRKGYQEGWTADVEPGTCLEKGAHTKGLPEETTNEVANSAQQQYRPFHTGALLELVPALPVSLACGRTQRRRERTLNVSALSLAHQDWTRLRG